MNKKEVIARLTAIEKQIQLIMYQVELLMHDIRVDEVDNNQRG